MSNKHMVVNLFTKRVGEKKERERDRAWPQSFFFFFFLFFAERKLKNRPFSPNKKSLSRIIVKIPNL